MRPDAEREVAVTVPLDLRRTLAIHLRGTGDPTLRFGPDGIIWRATRTAGGPATIRIEPGRDQVRVTAWGPGARAAVGAAEDLLGLRDEPARLVPLHPPVVEAARRLRGLRIGRTGAVLECLVPAILEQKITGDEARRTFRNLVRVYGEPAPGPGGLRLQPSAAVLARLPYHAFHPLGLEQRRAELIRSVAREAERLETLASRVLAAGAAGNDGGDGDDTAAALAEAYRRLRAFPGIGPWTAAEVGIRAFGDPDAVSVGDFHTPRLVAWSLAGEPRGTDERMLELLEPYRGQRGRVTRLLELAGSGPPRRGPRMPSRSITGL